MRIESAEEKHGSNNNFDLTRFFVTILARNPCARMAPTARWNPYCARAKLAGQINVRTTKARSSLMQKRMNAEGDEYKRPEK